MVIIWLYKSVSDRAYILYYIILYYMIFDVNKYIYIYTLYIYMCGEIVMVSTCFFEADKNCLWLWSFSEVQGGQELQQACGSLPVFFVGESAFSGGIPQLNQLITGVSHFIGTINYSFFREKRFFLGVYLNSANSHILDFCSQIPSLGPNKTQPAKLRGSRKHVGSTEVVVVSEW